MSNPRIPLSFTAELTRFLRDLMASNDRALANKLDKNSPAASVLLVSDGGYIYSVTVDDAGVLSTTLVQEP